MSRVLRLNPKLGILVNHRSRSPQSWCAIGSPVSHQGAALLEQVAPSISRFDCVAQTMRQRLIHKGGLILRHFILKAPYSGALLFLARTSYQLRPAPAPNAKQICTYPRMLGHTQGNTFNH